MFILMGELAGQADGDRPVVDHEITGMLTRVS